MGINKIGISDQQQSKPTTNNQVYELSTLDNNTAQNTTSTAATGSGKSMGPTRNDKVGLDSETRSYRAPKGHASNMRTESKSQTQRNGAGSKFVDYNAPSRAGNFF